LTDEERREIAADAASAQRPDIGNSFTSPPEAAAEMERRDRERREQAIEIEKLVTT
jgi:hypothetical protein